MIGTMVSLAVDLLAVVGATAVGVAVLTGPALMVRAWRAHRERQDEEARRLNAMMMLVDLDLTVRGVEHPTPPYIRLGKRGKRGRPDAGDAA